MRRATGVTVAVSAAVVAAVGLGLVGAGAPPPAGVPPPASPEVSSAPTPPRDLRPVRKRVDDLLADARLRLGGTVAVAVLDESGRTVVAQNADRLLIPASTQKLPTAAAALEVLGPEFRYLTRVAARQPPGPDGVLAGDLVLVGDGDPALSTPTFGRVLFPLRPRTALDALADDLAAAGLTAVAGNVVGDPWVLADEPVASGWKPTYLEDLDARVVSGLTIDAGLRWHMHGDDPATLRLEASGDPALDATQALTVLLEERGIQVAGAPAVAAAPTGAGHTLAAVHSPPLEDLLEHTLRHSDNHMADAVFRTLGSRQRRTGWAGAASAARRALDGLGLDTAGAVLADGSGLSRDNRLSAGSLAGLVHTMSAPPGGARWQHLQAVTGLEGTLRRWLAGTVAEGRFAGKSGSLEDVRAVAGTVRGPDGRRYHLAVIANDLAAGDIGVARVLMQGLVLTLAADLHRCEAPRVEPGPRVGVPRLVPGACPPSLAANQEDPR